jgi:hypothetical protein
LETANDVLGFSQGVVAGRAYLGVMEISTVATEARCSDGGALRLNFTAGKRPIWGHFVVEKKSRNQAACWLCGRY